MWDNPRQLNLAANALFVLVALILGAAGSYELVRLPAFPLKVLRIDGDLTRVERARIVEALQGRLRGTFFTTDLDQVRILFETVPWVRKAVVRRAWPDRLEVRIEEHVVLARWGRREDARLVNIQGEPFTAVLDADLPVFSGPQGSEREVARGYGEFARSLLPLGLELRQVSLSERHAWQLKLDSGLILQLGRDLARHSALDRLTRFVEVYPRTLGKMQRRLDYVDLRYANGFVLRVPGLQRLDDARPVRPKA